MARTPEQTARIRARQRAYLMAYAAFASSKSTAWTPTRLFASGEIGAWYDPSDLTTMFQDSAGTTPVTAVGQKVGLILDKSQGLVVAATELTTNGDFSGGGTGWNGGIGAISGGQLVWSAVVNNSGVYQSNAAYSGGVYEITVVVTSISSGAVTVTLGIGSPTSSNCINISTAGTHVIRQGNVSGDTFLRVYSVGASTTATIDSVSVKRVNGNHASQTTDTAKPILSARVNLLTYSEDFSNAAWTKAGGAISGSGETQMFTCNAGAGWHAVYRDLSQIGKANSISIVAKQGTATYIALTEGGFTSGKAAFFNLSAGTVGTVNGAGVTASISSDGNGWYRCKMNVASSTNGYFLVSIHTADNQAYNWTATGTETVYINKADLRSSTESTSLPVYQRIAAATDYDTTGFPYYLSFDGTDDFLVTGTINPGSVDKAQVFAGVRKLNDATSAVITEWSADIGTINGGFILMGPRSTGAIFSYHSKGTLLSQAISTASFAAPTTNVLTGISDISGDNATLRVNGIVNIAKTDDQGTGNFSSQVLYIGSRGGTAARFTGNIYSLIVRFSATNLSDSVISQAETWVNTKTLAY